MTEEMNDLAGQLVEEAVRIQIEMKELADRLGVIKDALKGNYEPGTHEFRDGKFFIKVTTNSRIDDKLAQSVLSPELYINVSKRTVDPVFARKVLTPELLTKITKTYENKIEFGIN